MQRRLIAFRGLTVVSVVGLIGIGTLRACSTVRLHAWTNTGSNMQYQIASRAGTLAFGRVFDLRSDMGFFEWHYVSVPVDHGHASAVLQGSTLLGFGGFVEVPTDRERRDHGLSTAWSIQLPHWFLMVLAAIPGCLALRWRRWFRPPSAPGRCVQCGYDLRASPHRCPECGLGAPPTTSPRLPSAHLLQGRDGPEHGHLSDEKHFNVLVRLHRTTQPIASGDSSQFFQRISPKTKQFVLTGERHAGC